MRWPWVATAKAKAARVGAERLRSPACRALDLEVS
jgi:hypothetical protein